MMAELTVGQHPSVLVIEDDADLRALLENMLGGSGFKVTLTADGMSALDAAESGDYDVAVLDLALPGMSGMDTLKRLRRLSHRIQVIIFTGFPTVSTAIEAVRYQVFDYLRKPEDLPVLQDVVQQAAEKARQARPWNIAPSRRVLAAPQSAPDEEMHRRLRRPLLIGESAAMRRLREQVQEVASSDMTVLLRGESGTGKDVVARLLHQQSQRGEVGEFVKVNCPAVPESLLESEMFGYEKGAFTGAFKQKPGRFEIAAGGSIFLEGIGKLSPHHQAELLEVIEHKAFVRVGGTDKIQIDCRIIAATNLNLGTMIQNEAFRLDLFSRLRQFTIVIPPLRERMEDLPLLVHHFLQKHASQRGVRPMPPESVLQQMAGYTWPGNVRELEGLVARYALTGDAESIVDALKQPAPASDGADGNGGSGESGLSSDSQHDGAVDTLQNQEITAIKTALAQSGWNQRQAAGILGLSYGALRRRIAKYDIQRPQFFADD